jgi:hypothetical protein
MVASVACIEIGNNNLSCLARGVRMSPALPQLANHPVLEMHVRPASQWRNLYLVTVCNF